VGVGEGLLLPEPLTEGVLLRDGVVGALVVAEGVGEALGVPLRVGEVDTYTTGEMGSTMVAEELTFPSVNDQMVVLVARMSSDTVVPLRRSAQQPRGHSATLPSIVEPPTEKYPKGEALEAHSVAVSPVRNIVRALPSSAFWQPEKL